MKKVCIILTAFLLSSSLASAMQNSLKLFEGEITKRALKSLISTVHFDFSKTPILEKGKAMQVFSRPTYDRIAKYILSEDEAVRIDILKSFTGITTISSATQLDEHYNPFDPFSRLRKLVNSASSKALFEEIRNSSNIKLTLEGRENKKAAESLLGLSHLYDDLVHAFPDHKYRSTVDFLCDTDFGYVTIEFQVAKQDYWDKRALAYIANIYGNQLKPEQDFDEIKNVIGINLLGDGSTPYWKDGNFIREYVFVDQKNSRNKISSLKLIQYSLGDVDLKHKDFEENQKLKQWIEFFKSAHEKESTPTSVDETVKKAYDMIRVDVLKAKHPELLKPSTEFFNALTEHNKAVEVNFLEKMLKDGKINQKQFDEFVNTIG